MFERLESRCAPCSINMLSGSIEASEGDPAQDITNILTQDRDDLTIYVVYISKFARNGTIELVQGRVILTPPPEDSRPSEGDFWFDFNYSATDTEGCNYDGFGHLWYRSTSPEPVLDSMDYNDDGVLDIHDIDRAIYNAATGAEPLRDLNGDGWGRFDDIDFLMEQLGASSACDSNLDGAFDTGDLVKVMAAGKYETGEQANFSEGDWNMDAQFTTNDLTMAFANCNYV